ncbi:MAG: YdbH domain-containing protein [Candidatus Omnitrophica bacterium]|nr:YdbH domain-containing protein [Candidatus Omnitrophota bacterium]
MPKKILIGFFVFICLLFIFQELILKISISCFLNNKFSFESQIEKVKFNLGSITIEGFSATKDDLGFDFKKAKIAFNLFSRTINDLNLSKATLEFKDINIDFTLRKSKRGSYILNISSLKFKNKEIKNISIPLIVKKGKIAFSRIDSNFLGYSSHASGALNYRDRNNTCLELKLEDFSFKKLINFFSKDKELTLGGVFEGRLQLCLNKGKIEELKGNFNNISGGTIDVEKETSLAFLEEYLDKASHDALVDNFRHYAYNKGRINIIKQGRVVTVNFDFDSNELGRRNISVNLHDIQGGRE